MRLNDNSEFTQSQLACVRQYVDDIFSKMGIKTEEEYQCVRIALDALYQNPSISIGPFLRELPNAELKERVEELQEILQSPESLLAREYTDKECRGSIEINVSFEEKAANVVTMANTIRECITRQINAYQKPETRERVALEREKARKEGAEAQKRMKEAAAEREKRGGNQNALSKEEVLAQEQARLAYLERTRMFRVIRDDEEEQASSEEDSLAVDQGGGAPIPPQEQTSSIRACLARLQQMEGFPTWILQVIREDDEVRAFANIASFMLKAFTKEELQEPDSQQDTEDLCKKLLLLEGGPYFEAFREASGLSTAHILAKPFEELELEFSLFKNLKIYGEAGTLTVPHIFSFSAALKSEIAWVRKRAYPYPHELYLHLFNVFRNGITLEQLEGLDSEIVGVFLKHCDRPHFKAIYDMQALLTYLPVQLEFALRHVKLIEFLFKQNITLADILKKHMLSLQMRIQGSLAPLWMLLQREVPLDQILSIPLEGWRFMQSSEEELLLYVFQNHRLEEALSIYSDPASLQRSAFARTRLPLWLFSLVEAENFIMRAPSLLSIFTVEQLQEPPSENEKKVLKDRLLLFVKYGKYVRDFLSMSRYTATDLLTRPLDDLTFELKLFSEIQYFEMENKLPLERIFSFPPALKRLIQGGPMNLIQVLRNGFSVEDLEELQRVNEPMLHVLLNRLSSYGSYGFKLPELVRLYTPAQVDFALTYSSSFCTVINQTSVTIAQLMAHVGNPRLVSILEEGRRYCFLFQRGETLDEWMKLPEETFNHLSFILLRHIEQVAQKHPKEALMAALLRVYPL